MMEAYLYSPFSSRDPVQRAVRVRRLRVHDGGGRRRPAEGLQARLRHGLSEHASRKIEQFGNGFAIIRRIIYSSRRVIPFWKPVFLRCMP